MILSIDNKQSDCPVLIYESPFGRSEAFTVPRGIEAVHQPDEPCSIIHVARLIIVLQDCLVEIIFHSAPLRASLKPTVIDLAWQPSLLGRFCRPEQVSYLMYENAKR
jgi:hypothetical protein